MLHEVRPGPTSLALRTQRPPGPGFLGWALPWLHQGIAGGQAGGLGPRVPGVPGVYCEEEGVSVL